MTNDLFTSPTLPADARGLFAGLGSVAAGTAEQVVRSLLPSVLPRLAAWSLRTVKVLPESDRNGAGYRDLLPVSEDRAHAWHFPRSNAAERIEAYLWLADKLKDSAFEKIAIRYANCMIDDPVRGIYHGDEEDGIGQVWYWRELGCYVTNYTIRVPSAMLVLAKRTGNSKYRDAASLCGRQLLHSQQLQTGILREGWWPRTPIPGFDPDKYTRALWISNVKINSRVGYVARAFADLLIETRDSKYADAIELLMDGLEKYQNPDGSFPADIRFDRIEVQDPTIKGHYMTYILNGFARAGSVLPQNKRVEKLAVRLGQFLVRRFRQIGALPYGDMHSNSEGEKYVWRSANPDAIFGMAWLSKVTGDPVYREVANRIALDTLLKVLNCPQTPDYHGAIPIWPNPNTHSLPEFDGYMHFWAILGLKALEDTAGEPV
jgi:hypothetical protein